MKICNLYCGLGGNRRLWDSTGKHEITAVEINPDIAKIYKDFFPNDNVIIADAHEYLLQHYKEFDFIWSSPPCPTHSKLRLSNKNIVYPDMSLYQEIILLKNFCKTLWVVENVQSYYDPLISCIKCGRHFIWSNFNIIPYSKKIENNPVKYWTYTDYEKYLGFNLKKYKFNGFDRRKILRNCVEPELGLYILEQALNIPDSKQKYLFEDTL